MTSSIPVPSQILLPGFNEHPNSSGKYYSLAGTAIDSDKGRHTCTATFTGIGVFTGTSQSVSFDWIVTFYEVRFSPNFSTEKIYIINNDAVSHSISNVILDPDVPDCTFSYTATIEDDGTLPPGSALPTSFINFASQPNLFTV